MIEFESSEERGYVLVTMKGTLTGRELADELLEFFSRPDLEPNSDYFWDLRELVIDGGFNEAARIMQEPIETIKTENPTEIRVAFLTGSAETKTFVTWYSMITAQPNLNQRLFEDPDRAFEWIETPYESVVSH